VSKVLINGQAVGTTNNLYRKYFIKIDKSIVKVGENIIEIVIESTVRESYKRAAENGKLPGNMADF
jgi:hypothetical protein